MAKVTMTVGLAERWIAELESGRYRKGTGLLCARPLIDLNGPERDLDGPFCYCPLGVLADMHGWLVPVEVLEADERLVRKDPAWRLSWTGITDPEFGGWFPASLPSSLIDGLPDPKQNELYLLSDRAEDFAPAVVWIRGQIDGGVWGES